MQFRVVAPANVKPGQEMRVACPDGTQAIVKVPKDVKAGDAFYFHIAVDQLKNPQQMLDLLKDGSTVGSSVTRKGLLDRDISNFQDFLVALCVGLTIGASIVFGFLAGILYATRNVAVASEGIAATQSGGLEQMPQIQHS